MELLAARMQYLQASGIRRMFELAASMKNPLNLSLGQADFDVPAKIKELAADAIRAGRNRYSVTAGIPEFQKAIAEALQREGIEPQATMAVAGGSGGLILALLALVGPGDEVLVPDPYFVSYENMVRFAEAEPKFISTYPDFKLTPEKLEAAASPRSKVLLFNTPVNPTGVAYTKEEVVALVKTAKRLGLRVVSDEVYDLFCYDFPHESWVKHDSDAILVRSFSKTWGMPGWRVGYVNGPAAIVDQMKVLQQFSFVCVPTPFQYACAEALKLSMDEYRESYTKKRNLAFEGLSSGFKVDKPGGAFYIFPEYPGGDAERFLAKCLEQEVLIVPGSTFSQKNTHFRVSYALDNETLQKGVEKLLQIANSCR